MTCDCRSESLLDSGSSHDRPRLYFPKLAGLASRFAKGRVAMSAWRDNASLTASGITKIVNHARMLQLTASSAVTRNTLININAPMTIRYRVVPQQLGQCSQRPGANVLFVNLENGTTNILVSSVRDNVKRFSSEALPTTCHPHQESPRLRQILRELLQHPP
jgi:hypothetical protein